MTAILTATDRQPTTPTASIPTITAMDLVDKLLILPTHQKVMEIGAERCAETIAQLAKVEAEARGKT